LQRAGERSVHWFAYKQVNVFRHHYVTRNEKAIPEADGLKGTLKEFALGTGSKVWQAAVA
jgi:hypothetical protein